MAGTMWAWMGGAAALGLYVLLMTVIGRRTAARLPRGVVRRLTHSPQPYVVRVNALGGTWNPGRPFDRDNLVRGPGVATYWLDAQGQVHLRYQPATKGAPVFEASGPIASLVVAGTAENARSRRGRWLAAAVLGAWLAPMLAGALVGSAVAMANHLDPLLGGMVGLGLGWMLALLAFLGIMAGRAIRSLGHGGSPS